MIEPGDLTARVEEFRKANVHFSAPDALLAWISVDELVDFIAGENWLLGIRSRGLELVEWTAEVYPEVTIETILIEDVRSLTVVLPASWYRLYAIEGLWPRQDGSPATMTIHFRRPVGSAGVELHLELAANPDDANREISWINKLRRLMAGGGAWESSHVDSGPR